MAHILVAGLGDLGSALAQGWLASGHQVSAIRRGTEAPAGIDLYPQDLFSDPVQLPPDQIDLLYIIMTPSTRDEAGYRAAYLTAPARLLDALIEQQPLPPVIFVSSTAVYGEQGGMPDELQEPRPEAFNGRILLAAEQEISLRTLSSAVRFSGIYGPGRERLLHQVNAIRQGGKGPSPRWTNRIHSQDCVGLLYRIGEGWLRGEMQWPVVVGTDAAPALNVAVLNWIAEQTGQAIDLAEPDIAPGKRIRSRFIEEGNYKLSHPDYRSGYATLI
ncbi:NAD-dependent epimerase/dehydratase family protein [Alcanivorax sp. 1008]|uniref:NAD-dependent epimerase/dehydratase family protein n=1 Tax=Alcanivorax sp. 1008 TaxID=2816853 RepID=UPI001D74EBDD|nr:NAD-dependent epimerase/dehydratase family protein [Alcanivorax sp. 1008]MCC1497448.1 NAD-dependent dehydratase [Alcanivorax sp. 1008]